METNGQKAIADDWRTDDTTSESIEWGYHQILASVHSANLHPDSHAWAVLDHLEKEFEMVRGAMKNWRPNKNQSTDPANMRVDLPNGVTVQPDHYLTQIVAAATASLKMLGHDNKWFHNDVRFVLPQKPDNTNLNTDIVESIQSLALIWQLLERTDEHIRFFGGDAKIERKETKHKNGKTVQKNVLACDLKNIPFIVYDKIAHERAERMQMQFMYQLNFETPIEQAVSSTTPISLPPETFVSNEEAHANITISDILCKATTGHQEEIGGLRIIEWIRGYASLRLFAQNQLQQKRKSINQRAVFDQGYLCQFLVDRGLTATKANCFIEAIIFSKCDSDLFDAPLLCTTNGDLVLCADIASETNPAEAFLSKMSTISKNFAWRGPAFEDRVCKLFEKNSIQVRHIKRKVDGEELEVDCVVYWEKTIFVFECKNVSLSGKSHENTYRFSQEQQHAVKQVVKKHNLLLDNTTILNEVFGEQLNIERSVAVVLNARPFSIGKWSDGVYVYDFSSLKRFFEERHINVNIPATIGKYQKVLRKHGIKALWSGESPTPNDLIHQLNEPLQVKVCLGQYVWSQVELPMGENTTLSTSKIYREAATLEDDLDAMGIDATQGGRKIQAVRSEFSKGVQELRDEVKKRVSEDG